jgi:translocation and assembly module TamB
MNGFILKPHMDMNGRISNVLVNDSPAKASQFRIRLEEDQVSGSASLIGKTIEGKLVWPLTSKAPFHLKLKTEEWDFAPFFSLFSSASTGKGFETQITSEIELFSSSGDLWKSNGLISVSDFLIRRGHVEMYEQGPMKINVENGIFNTDNFRIEGPNSFLSLQAQNNTKNNIDLKLNGKLDLSLVLLLTPFFDELQGRMSFSTEIQGNSDRIQLMGSSYIQNGRIKLTAFPHPFERISADILFSENSLFLNSLNAELGGGTVQADGKVSYVSRSSLPIVVQGKFKDVKLNVPEGFETNGEGQFYVSGKAAPYELGVEYKVNGGAVNKNLNENKGDLETVRPSDYLPKFLAEESFTPISLNLDIDIKKSLPVNLSFSNAQITTPVTGHLKVQGLPTQPTLTGLISTQQPGQVLFRENRFEIRNGQVEYNQDPAENPSLNVTAETRINDEYDITLLVQGEAKNPKIDISSSPPLAEHEIISLLALGITSEELESKTDTNELAAQTSLQLGSALLKEQLGIGQQGQKNSGWDIDIGAFYDSESQATIPELTMKKQWTPKFGTSVKTSKQKELSSEFRAEYKMNNNLSVIGSFERTEEESEKTTTQPEVFGLDLEYKFEFK